GVERDDDVARSNPPRGGRDLVERDAGLRCAFSRVVREQVARRFPVTGEVNEGEVVRAEGASLGRSVKRGEYIGTRCVNVGQANAVFGFKPSAGQRLAPVRHQRPKRARVVSGERQHLEIGILLSIDANADCEDAHNYGKTIAAKQWECRSGNVGDEPTVYG